MIDQTSLALQSHQPQQDLYNNFVPLLVNNFVHIITDLVKKDFINHEQALFKVIQELKNQQENQNHSELKIDHQYEGSQNFKTKMQQTYGKVSTLQRQSDALAERIFDIGQALVEKSYQEITKIKMQQEINKNNQLNCIRKQHEKEKQQWKQQIQSFYQKQYALLQQCMKQQQEEYVRKQLQKHNQLKKQELSKYLKIIDELSQQIQHLKRMAKQKKQRNMLIQTESNTTKNHNNTNSLSIGEYSRVSYGGKNNVRGSSNNNLEEEYYTNTNNTQYLINSQGKNCQDQSKKGCHHKKLAKYQKYQGYQKCQRYQKQHTLILADRKQQPLMYHDPKYYYTQCSHKNNCFEKCCQQQMRSYEELITEPSEKKIYTVSVNNYNKNGSREKYQRERSHSHQKSYGKEKIIYVGKSSQKNYRNQREYMKNQYLAKEKNFIRKDQLISRERRKNSQNGRGNEKDNYDLKNQIQEKNKRMGSVEEKLHGLKRKLEKELHAIKY